MHPNVGTNGVLVGVVVVVGEVVRVEDTIVVGVVVVVGVDVGVVTWQSTKPPVTKSAIISFIWETIALHSSICTTMPAPMQRMLPASTWPGPMYSSSAVSRAPASKLHTFELMVPAASNDTSTSLTPSASPQPTFQRTEESHIPTIWFSSST